LKAHQILKFTLSLYLKKWYIPILIAALLCYIGLEGLSIKSQIIAYLSLGIPFLALFISAFLGFRKFFKRNYITGTLQLMSTSLLGLAMFTLLVFFYPIINLTFMQTT